jgi:hypothetical protein
MYFGNLSPVLHGNIPKSMTDLDCGLSLEDSRNGITQLSPKAVLLGPEDD